MASYEVQTRNGSTITVPDFASLTIDGIQIIGDQTLDWNEPYNKNFLVLDKKIMVVENAISGSTSKEEFDLLQVAVNSIKNDVNILKSDTHLTELNTEVLELSLRLDSISNSINSAVTALGNKVDKVSGKGLSSNDYTDTDKTKLGTVEPGAQVNKVTSVNGKIGDVTVGVNDVTGLSAELSTMASDIAVASIVPSAIDFFGDKSCIATFLLNGNADSLDGKYKGVIEGLKFVQGRDLLCVQNDPTLHQGYGQINTGYVVPSNVSTITVSLWMKSEAGCVLVSFGNTGVSQAAQYTGGVQKHFSFIQGSTVDTDYTAPSFDSNGWNHVVVQFNNTSRGKFWINGVELNVSLLGTKTVIPFVGKELILAPVLRGMMSNVKVFDRALTLAEVNELYMNDTSFGTVEDVYDIVVSKTDSISSEVTSVKTEVATVKAKLDTVESGAQVNTVNSVAGKTGDIQLDINDISGLNTAIANAGSNIDLTAISGDILPSQSSVYNIGSANKRFKGIYVDEAYLAVHTLYLGDTPILGTDQSTVNIHANDGQSISIKTVGEGVSTTLTSTSKVQLSTNGMNADVLMQASGSGSKVRIGGEAGVDINSHVNAQSSVSIAGDLTLTGKLIQNGIQTVVNSEVVQVRDNIMDLNYGEVGDGVTAGESGIRVMRGGLPSAKMIFDDADDQWKIGLAGSTLGAIATKEYVASLSDSTKANVQHTHSIIEVNGLQAQLDNKISFTSANTLDLGEL